MKLGKFYINKYDEFSAFCESYALNFLDVEKLLLNNLIKQHFNIEIIKRK
jgi:hypothetical protein